MTEQPATGNGFATAMAVVTGSSSGIGLAITEALLTAGASVAGVDVSAVPDDLHGDHADRYVHHRADVSDEDGVRTVVDRILARGPVTHLFNVAGIGSTTSAPDTPIEVWDRVFAVNARGTFLMCKYLIPSMVEQGRGSILNMGSVAGLVGLKNRAAYCAAKGAVISLTRALAVDHVADGIRVNCVCPGTVDSPWVRRLVEDVGESIDALRARQPMGRLGTPDEIAKAAMYLAGDDAEFVTGSALVIDGGLTAA